MWASNVAPPDPDPVSGRGEQALVQTWLISLMLCSKHMAEHRPSMPIRTAGAPGLHSSLFSFTSPRMKGRPLCPPKIHLFMPFIKSFWNQPPGSVTLLA